MMMCDECKWAYPDWMLSPLRTNIPSQNNKLICGICALRISNEIHGLNRIKFNGSNAEYYRVHAVRWRERNPQAAPDYKEAKNDNNA